MRQIQVQQFVCEYCSRGYKTEDECKKCEDTHQKNPQFTGLRYVPYKEDDKGFPHTVEVTFDGGAKVVYKFAKQLTEK